MFFDSDLTKTVMASVENLTGKKAEFIFFDSPDIAVFRHDSGKWFAVFMNIPYRKLGINREGNLDIVNLKCEPNLISLLVGDERFFRGYHMNKEHWLSVPLDSRVSLEEIMPLVKESYNLTTLKKERKL